MPIQSKAVANYFLELAGPRGGLTPLKLQKLVYFAHGWHLAFTDTPLIEDEFQAWEYGPVVPTLYHEFKKWGKGNIGEHARSWERVQHPDGKDTSVHARYPSLDDRGVVSSNIDIAFVKSLLAKTWETYKSFNGFQMSQLTHAQDGPWDRTRSNNPGLRSVGISNKDIKEYFGHKLEANRARRNG